FKFRPSMEPRIATTSNKQSEWQDLETTRELLNSGKPEDALAIIQNNSEHINNRTDVGKEWLDLLIRASETTINIPQLVLLYEYYPKAFESHEKAALLVANQYLLKNLNNEYLHLRGVWKGRETQPEVWFGLDADQLLLDGKRKEAIEFL